MVFLPDLPGPFVDNVDMPVAAADVNALLRLALDLDGMSYRRMETLDSGAHIETEYFAGNVLASYRGRAYTIPYIGGFTSIVVAGNFNKVGGSQSISIRVNGTQRDTVTASGFFSSTITVSSSDAPSGLIEVELVVLNSPSGNQYNPLAMLACYGVRPTPGGWPGTPTWSSGSPTYPAANFTQLANAAQWLADYLYGMPRCLQLAHLWTPANYPRVETRPLYSGAVGRYFAQDVLRIYGAAITYRSQERLIAKINGTTVYTGTTWTPGQRGFVIELALSHTLGTRTTLELLTEVQSISGTDDQRPSRYILTAMRSEAGSGGYPAATPPSFLTPFSDVSQSSLTSTLNSISTILANTYTRATSNSALWGRIWAQRRRYGWRDDHNSQIHRFAPRVERIGNRLTVRGKGVKLLWGPLVLESPLTEAYTYEGSNSQDVCAADKVETKVIYLDTIKGLDVGTAYTLLGDVYCSWEDSE